MRVEPKRQIIAGKRLVGMFGKALFESVEVPVADCEPGRLMMAAIAFEDVAAALEAGNDVIRGDTAAASAALFRPDLVNRGRAAEDFDEA